MREGLHNIHSNVPESSLEILKGWSLGRLVGPAFKHDVVEGRGAVLGEGKTFTILDLANHFIVFNTLKGLDAIHQNLPHTHT